MCRLKTVSSDGNSTSFVPILPHVWRQLEELLLAAERGDLDRMRLHLRMGVDPSDQSPEFLTTPLIEAARLGQVVAVQWLLDHGAAP